MASLTQYLLSHGWSFKDSADESAEAWMPVHAVPSVVQQDLQENGQYVRHKRMLVSITDLLVLTTRSLASTN